MISKYSKKFIHKPETALHILDLEEIFEAFKILLAARAPQVLHPKRKGVTGNDFQIVSLQYHSSGPTYPFCSLFCRINPGTWFISINIQIRVPNEDWGISLQLPVIRCRRSAGGMSGRILVSDCEDEGLHAHIL